MRAHGADAAFSTIARVFHSRTSTPRPDSSSDEPASSSVRPAHALRKTSCSTSAGGARGSEPNGTNGIETTSNGSNGLEPHGGKPRGGPSPRWLHLPPLLAGTQPVMGDLSALETIVNVVTCAPYFVMAAAVPGAGAGVASAVAGASRLWRRLVAISCGFVGACATLYHVCTGNLSREARHICRRLDYVAIALSAVAVSCAQHVPRPLFLSAISLAIAPFQPLLVAACHLVGVEVTFACRALRGGPGSKIRSAHAYHTATSFAAFLCFYADDWYPGVPYLHAAWHMLSSYATASTFCLIQ